jgi:two-component system, sensor histidine kinase LadS
VKRNTWFRIFIVPGALLLALIAFNSTIAASARIQSNTPLLILHDGQEEYLLGMHMASLEDPSQTLGIEQVSSAEYADQFIPGEKDILNFGLKDSAYWLRFTIKNESTLEKRWLLELARPSMNSVFLYTPLSDGNGYTEKKTGYVFPFPTRDIPHENFVFVLEPSPGKELTYYLRVKDITLDLPLRIWSSRAFDLHDQASRMLLGLSFGALFAMLIYNGILLITLHDLGHVYYAFFQTFLILYLGSIQGYVPRFLWPNDTLPNFYIIPFSIELAGIFQILFSWEFLHFVPDAKWPRYIRNALIAVLAGSIPFTFVVGARILILILPVILIMYLCIFLLGVWALWRGYKPARYYLFSWSIYLVIGFGAILQHMGWFTARQMIPEQAFQFGAIYFVTFQSLALADRIRFYKQENLNAQNELILQQEETLSVKDELNATLENARVELEARVALRTRELIDLNGQLSEEINERKRAEDELIQLASVDFLTGIFNRRYFFEIAMQEFARSVHDNLPLSVILFDIDIFKNVNDTYGHLVGDQALIHIGKLILEAARKTDISARYGGEEFIILMKETDCSSAYAIAEQLRYLVENSPVQSGEALIKLTISVGVAGRESREIVENLDQLISLADQAMYRAKNAGRNRVVCDSEHLS